MNKKTHRAAALVFALQVLVRVAVADTVNPGNITVFSDGQPARAGEVNGNFDELITQINDHATRLADREANGLVLGDSFQTVDCDDPDQGADALQAAIAEAKNTNDLIDIQASGSCGAIRFDGRYVRIQALGPLTIRGDGVLPAIEISNGLLRLFGFAGAIIVDGNGADQALRTGAYTTVAFVGNVDVLGAAQQQVAVFQNSQFICGGNCSIGAVNDGATGLQLEQSLALFFNIGGAFVDSVLNINSSGTALLMDASSFETFELGPGSTQLNMPNAREIEIINNSSALFGPSTITTSGDGRFRITDNSSVSLGSELFDSAQGASWNTSILVDRGASLRLNVEEAPTDVAFVHSGDLEVALNGTLEVFGANDGTSGFPATMTVGSGIGAEAFLGLGASVVVNGATFAFDTTTVLNGNLALAQFARLEGTPSISVAYNGTILDVVDDAQGTTDTSTLSGDVSSCSSGGIAYGSTGAEACP